MKKLFHCDICGSDESDKNELGVKEVIRNGRVFLIMVCEKCESKKEAPEG